MIKNLSDQLESYSHEVYSIASFLAKQKGIALSDALKCVEIATRDMTVDALWEIATVFRTGQVSVSVDGRLETLSL